MNYLFSNTLYSFVVIYLDDILIYSKSYEEHLKPLSIIFSILKGAGLKAKIYKCKFLKHRIEYLGFMIKNNQTSIPLKQKTKAHTYVQPTSVKELRSFVGYTIYFRRFIPNYTVIILPLYGRI